MKVQSLANVRGKTCLIEVEVTVLKGLPQIHILGLPDRMIRENEIKIRCALKRQGFEFPKAQQILVNLRPAGALKSSRGLDLAIALGVLMETAQIPINLFPENAVIYGELGLNGDVFAPEDLLEVLHSVSDGPLVTGNVVSERIWDSLKPVPSMAVGPTEAKLQTCASDVGVVSDGIDVSDVIDTSENDHAETGESYGAAKKSSPKNQKSVWLMDRLKNWEELRTFSFRNGEDIFRRPTLPNLKFSLAAARQLMLMSLSGAHSLLAGPAGTGKSTMMSVLPLLAETPNRGETREIALRDPRAEWRPTQQPHHSLSLAGFLGGGTPFHAGTLFHAHQGFLLMDELLEFRPDLIESLRQPLARQELCIDRFRSQTRYLSRFQMIATTNLCPCGDWCPGRIRACHYNHQRCFRHLHKLSGPVLDRFHALFFITEREGRSTAQLSLAEVLERIESVRRWKEDLQNNSAALYEDVADGISVPKAIQAYIDGASQRREESLRLLARTAADLDQVPRLQIRHWREALEICVSNFLNLKKGD